MIVLGIDPGTRIVGYGVVKQCGRLITPLDYGSIQPPPKEKLSIRYSISFKAVSSLIEQYEPDVVAVETQFVGKNVQSALKLGMARGVVLIAAREHGIPIFEYAPTKAKQAVVGTGKASKEQVQRMVKTLLNLEKIPKPEDAADALAIAICHLHASQSALPIGVEV